MMTKNQTTKALIRGGQLFMYTTTMWIQVMRRMTKWGILLCGMIFVVCFFLLSYDIHWQTLYLQLYSKVLTLLGMETKHVWETTGPPARYITAQSWLMNQAEQHYITGQWQQLVHNAIMALWVGLPFYFLALWLISRFFIQSGRKQSVDQIISGTYLAKTAKETIQSVEAFGASDIRLFHQLPLPKRAEYQGILFHGTTGSGKTQGLMQLLDAIKASGDPVIVYDKECSLKPYYFNPERDIELNPISAHCVQWDLWQECQTPIELNALATYLMPKSVQGTDPFWVDAARTIFVAAAWAMRDDPKRSAIRLLQTLLTTSMNDFRQILRQTEAENLVSKDIEKTAISIRAVLATYTKSLRFMAGLETLPTAKQFAIRDWIKTQAQSEHHPKDWLFITSRANIHGDIKPLISTWIGMAMKGIQSLPAGSKQRFWIVLDELASLHRLEDLSDVAADIRKFGGCFVVGLQSISQLEFINGPAEASAITDLLNTSIYLRSPKERVARWVSKDLGEQVVEEVRESQSYGPNAIRDGNTISRQRITRATVDAGTIMQLNPLECFVRLSGNHPITHLKQFAYQERPICFEPALVERPIDWDALKKLQAEAAQLEQHEGRDDGVKTEQARRTQTDQAVRDEAPHPSHDPADPLLEEERLQPVLSPQPADDR